MALTDQQQEIVDTLRTMVGEVDLDADALFDRYTAAGSSLNLAAANVWGYKAAASADLIDVQEGSTKRPLSQLRGAALAMEAKYRAAADAEGGSSATGARTSLRPILRRKTY
jgi:hypothetical protein